MTESSSTGRGFSVPAERVAREGRAAAPSGRRELTKLETAVAVSGFPLLVTVGIGGAILAIGRDVDPGLVTGALVPAAFLAVAIAERLVPWQSSWLHSKGDLRTDIGLLFANGVTDRLLAPALFVAAATAGAVLSARIGTGMWPVEWPLLAQLALALVVVELVEYTFHRLMHEVPFLWRIHATHHSAPRLYWLNSARFHPIDLFLVSSVKMVPLAVCGAGPPVFALVTLFAAIHGAYQHANLPVRLGPLNWIFSMTELHRWHHSKRMEEANHNYGGNLAVWDVVFGTRYLPKDREPPEAIGIEALPAFPMGFWANLASPFRWNRLVAQATEAPASSGVPLRSR